MKKTLVTIVGSVLVILSAAQFAAATEHHHGKPFHRAATEFRNSNAYVAPSTEPGWYRYSGGYSDMAGR